MIDPLFPSLCPVCENAPPFCDCHKFPHPYTDRYEPTPHPYNPSSASNVQAEPQVKLAQIGGITVSVDPALGPDESYMITTRVEAGVTRILDCVRILHDEPLLQEDEVRPYKQRPKGDTLCRQSTVSVSETLESWLRDNPSKNNPKQST